MVIAIYSNPHNDKEYRGALAAAAYLLAKGVQVCMEEGLGLTYPKGVVTRAPGELCARADFMLVLGGDGTILSAAQLAVAHATPIVGVNLGRIGFLAPVEFDDMLPRVDDLLRGEFTVEERIMLQAQVLRGDELLLTGTALNDFYLLSCSPNHRMMRLNVRVDGHMAGHYAADGIIVATPTGSTAYSLSAGGPVLSPNMRCMAITPICPHVLQARPIIVGDTQQVTLHTTGDRGLAALHGDGRELLRLLPGDVVSITRAQVQARFVRFDRQRNFYDILSGKLSQGSL